MEKSFTPSAKRKHKWRSENPELYLKSNRERHWKLYGLDVEKANVLRDATFLCAICERKETLCVDHCHASGNLRGMLCRRCNLGLGVFEDNPNLMRHAAAYLDYHAGVDYN